MCCYPGRAGVRQRCWMASGSAGYPWPDARRAARIGNRTGSQAGHNGGDIGGWMCTGRPA